MPNIASRGDNRTIFQQMGRSHNPNIILAMYGRGEISSEKSIDKLEQTDRYGRLEAAHMAVEQAMYSANFDEASFWLGRAEVGYQKVVATDVSTEKLDDKKALAMFHLSQLPLLSYMACFDSLPPVKLVESVYKKTTATIKEISQTYQQNRSQLLAGILAEAGVILLGQRYAINSVGDGSWLSMHSLYGEDHANRHHHTENRAWDVTFFTDMGSGPERSYLVQVKTSIHGRNNNRHNENDIEGITPLYFMPDITLKREGYEGLVNTINELHAEASGYSHHTRNLDQRTDKMLDILG